MVVSKMTSVAMSGRNRGSLLAANINHRLYRSEQERKDGRPMTIRCMRMCRVQ